MKIDLRKFRESKGLSQAQIGKLFGTKQANISMLENKDRALTPDQYRILCDNFGESEVLKYLISNDHSHEVYGSVSISTEAWNMINQQMQIIKDQQETIKSQQKTIEFFSKKVGHAQNVRDANVG